MVSCRGNSTEHVKSKKQNSDLLETLPQTVSWGGPVWLLEVVRMMAMALGKQIRVPVSGLKKWNKLF